MSKKGDDESKMTETEIINKHRMLQAECEGFVKKLSELDFEVNEHR